MQSPSEYVRLNRTREGKQIEKEQENYNPLENYILDTIDIEMFKKTETKDVEKYSQGKWWQKYKLKAEKELQKENSQAKSLMSNLEVFVWKNSKPVWTIQGKPNLFPWNNRWIWQRNSKRNK